MKQASLFATLERQGTKETKRTSVTWNVLPLYFVAPSEVYFGTVDPATSKEVVRRILIRRTDGKPLAIKAGNMFRILETAGFGRLRTRKQAHS